MFRALATGLLALAAVPALAGGSAAHCAGLAESAAQIMEARQLGIAEAQLLALAQGGPATDSLTWIIEEAYDEPVRMDEAQKLAAATAFARAIESACLAG